MIKKWITAFIFVVLLAGRIEAKNYYVTKQGNQGNDGLSLNGSFPTIQQGVNALKPGDTLSIGPGEYYENVVAENLGDNSKVTTIKAQIPGTVLLRGDVQPPDFIKVPGYKFVYSAKFERVPRLLQEIDTLSVFKRRTAIENLEFEPGSFYYDFARKILYLSSSDMKPPSRHRYSVAVSPTSGFFFVKPVKLVLEGLSATGFQNTGPGWSKYYFWGFRLEEPVGCVIRNCTAYLNSGGIALHRGGKDNIIEDCVVYGNTSQFQEEGGNIVRFGGNNDIIRNCYSYLSGGKGISFYGKGPGPVLLKNNLAWGNSLIDIRIKGRGKDPSTRAENCIALRHGMVYNIKNSLVGDNLYRRSLPKIKSNVWIAKLNLDQEFADPLNMDFRLQGDSKLRGTGSNGSDRGPYPYKKNIFYVRPKGKDTNTGLSMRSAWRTLPRTIKKLKPGDTLYLDQGDYPGDIEFRSDGKTGDRIYIRGRRYSPVVIKGKVAMDSFANVTFERVIFAQPVILRNCTNIEFKNCVFQNRNSSLAADAVKELKITHCVFPAAPLAVKSAENLYLSGNIYARAIKLDLNNSKLRYSDYNSYPDPAALKAMPDQYSEVIKPEFEDENGVLTLKNAYEFASQGLNGTSIGIYLETRKKPISLAGPFLHSVSDTTANIEWWTSTPAISELTWGETPECKNTIKYDDVGFQYGSYTLTDLKPGTKYYFTIRKVEPAVNEIYKNITGTKINAEPLTFQTSAKPAATVVYYVAPDGNNTNDGKSRRQAFRTINKAAEIVNAGDTVLIAGGIYKETVFIRAGGDQGKPITFKTIPGEKVVFDGADGSPEEPFIVFGKSYLNFDGFYFNSIRKPTTHWSGIFYLYRSNHINITRCFMDARGKGNGNLFLYARQSSDVSVRNCVIFNGFQGMYFVSCPNLYLENNVFLRNWICPVLASNGPDQKIYLKNNVITDSIPFKVKVHLFEVTLSKSFIDDGNCYYLRVPDEERKMFLFYRDPDVMHLPNLKDRRISLAQYKKKVRPTKSFVANPWFKVTVGMKEERKMGKYGPEILLDRIVSIRPLDFPDLFATNPDVIGKGIGLQPEAFKDFHFAKKHNPEKTTKDVKQK